MTAKIYCILMIMASFALSVLGYSMLLDKNSWGWLGFLVGLLFSSGIIWAWRDEGREWNNGTCRANGLPWEHRDTDSQGGRMYRAGDITTWISYPVDKKRK